MAVFFESGYTLPGADQPRTHARIAHSGNWFSNVIATPNSTATGYSADGPMGLTSFETWRPYDNLCAAPADWSDAAWTKARVTVDGFKITEDSSTNTHFISDAITFSAASYVFSVNAKADERGEISLTLTDGVAANGFAYFDLRDGTVGTVSPGETARIQHIGDGVYRCTLIWTASGGAGSAIIGITDGAEGGSYTGDGASGLFVYRAFLSRGASTYDIDLRAAKEADYCVIGAHNLGTAGAAVLLQYNNSGYATVMTVTPTDDSPIWLMFEPETRQEWRLLISSAVEPTIGNIKIGKALQLPRPVGLQSHAPWEFQRQTELRTNYSATGEILGRRVQRIRNETSYEVANVAASWAQTNWPSFQRAAENAPIYVAWRPDGTYPGVSFGEVPEVPQAVHTGPRDLMSISFTLTGPGYD